MSEASREQLLEERLKRLELENQLLRQKLDLLLRRLYGPSSERLSPLGQEDFLAKLELLEAPCNGEEDKKGSHNASSKPKPKRRAKREGPRVPAHLPTEREELKPQAVIEAPEKYRRIGEEISEQLDFRPAQFVRLQLVRPKFVSIEEPHRAPIIAPLPERWKARSIATPALLTQITISKYVDHLPLYRQEQIYQARHGVELPRNTMAQWIGDVAEQFKLIYLYMILQMRGSSYLQVDETPVKYLQPGAGKTAQGYFWCYSKPKGDIVFDWRTGRGHECLIEMLHSSTPLKDIGNPFEKETKPFKGFLQCDGYSAYMTYSGKVEAVELVGCMAHVRRKFREAMESAPRQAGWIIGQMRELYRIEEELRKSGASAKRREVERARQSAPIMKRLKKALMLFKARASILPQSPLGKAVGYALSEWSKLEWFLSHGALELDNNLVENGIRPTALGKKNWLFIGGAETGERSAIIYSMLESCRRQGIDAHEYVHDVLRRLPTASTANIPELTPSGWLRARQKEAQRKVA